MSTTTSTLPPHKLAFLRASIDGGILKFGSFALKSGRVSPYFFNAGDFHRADLLHALSTAFAQTILEASSAPSTSTTNTASPSTSPLEFDIIFGPAYKGIPLACLTLAALSLLSPAHMNKSYAFDRKEAKTHGEGGGMVGAPLKGKRVLIVDDVVTAGTAKREAIAKIRAEGGEVVGILVALDRMETLPGEEGRGKSAIGEIRREYGIPVWAILTLDDIIEGLKGLEGGIGEEELGKMEVYRGKYKASD